MLYEKSSQCNILLTFLFLDLINAAVAITGHQEDNKPSMYTLPWALADEWNGEVHRRDELLTRAKQIER